MTTYTDTAPVPFAPVPLGVDFPDHLQTWATSECRYAVCAYDYDVTNVPHRPEFAAEDLDSARTFARLAADLITAFNARHRSENAR